MGSTIITVILLIASIILLAIAGGFATNAAVRLTDDSVTGYKKNPGLQAAHSLLSWAAVATWIGVVLIIGLLIFYLVEGGGFGGKFIANLFLFFTIALIVLVGILSAIAAARINSSGATDSNGAYRQAIIAAVLALGVVFLFILVFIIAKVSKSRARKAKLETLNEEEKAAYLRAKETKALAAKQRDAKILAERRAAIKAKAAPVTARFGSAAVPAAAET